jgi:hypothetical protein
METVLNFFMSYTVAEHYDSEIIALWYVEYTLSVLNYLRVSLIIYEIYKNVLYNIL